MSKLTDFTSYADAQQQFAPARLWDLFDGDREHLNIAHECIDRHAGAEHPALIVAHADGSDEVLGFDALAASSSRFAHWLAARGVQAGDRIRVTAVGGRIQVAKAVPELAAAAVRPRGLGDGGDDGLIVI